MNQKIYQIPVFGYWLKTLAIMLRLPTRLLQLEEKNSLRLESLAAVFRQYQIDVDRRFTAVEKSIQDLNPRFQAVEDRATVLETLPEKIDAVLAIRREMSVLSAALSRTPSAPGESLDDAFLDTFYRDFEEEFRGSRELIKSRVEKYLPHFQQAGIDYAQYPILDIGCGRGEWLEVLGAAGHKAKGLDINQEMVDYSRSLGLDVEQGDVLSYLGKQPARTFGGITGFHIVEHLPLPTLIRLFDECLRVLVPGGLVLFETPNPENVCVGSCNFYADPTHKNPIPPETLRFMARQRGFPNAEIIRFADPVQQQEDEKIENPELRRLIAWTHVSVDYSVLAKR